MYCGQRSPGSMAVCGFSWSGHCAAMRGALAPTHQASWRPRSVVKSATTPGHSRPSTRGVRVAAISSDDGPSTSGSDKAASKDRVLRRPKVRRQRRRSTKGQPSNRPQQKGGDSAPVRRNTEERTSVVSASPHTGRDLKQGSSAQSRLSASAENARTSLAQWRATSEKPTLKNGDSQEQDQQGRHAKIERSRGGDTTMRSSGNRDVVRSQQQSSGSASDVGNDQDNTWTSPGVNVGADFMKGFDIPLGDLEEGDGDGTEGGVEGDEELEEDDLFEESEEARARIVEMGGFDMGEIFGIPDFSPDKLEKIVALEKDDDDDDDDEDDELDGEEEIDDEGEEEEEMAFEIEGDLSDAEAKRFLKRAATIDANELLQGKELFRDPKFDYDKEQTKEGGFEYDIEREMVELIEQVFKRPGKKPNRQNWDHIHVSDEVKRKRVAKRAKRLSVWLSIEISKVAQSALDRIDHIPRGSAKARAEVKRCLDGMTDLIALQEPKFNCRNATAMVQRIANVSVKGGVQDFVIQQYGSVLTSLFVLIKAKWKEMDARQISELVWSFARLGSAMLTLRAPPMDLKTVGETTIGNVDAGELFVELVEMSEDYCKDFTPTDVLILVRGIVDMPYPKGYGTAQRLIAGLKSIVTDFNSQDVANLLWCLTKPELGSHDDLLVDVVKHAETLVREFTPQGVANTAWALAKLQCQECEALLAVIATTVEDNLEGFKPQEVANLAWAMARLMYLPRHKFLSRLADLGADRLRLFNFQETCNLLFAFSVFAFQDPGFLAACRAKFLGAGSDVGLRDAMSAVASFAVLDCLDDDIMSWAIQRADDHGFENMNASQRRQLYQGVLHMRLMQPDAQAVAQIPVEVDVTCRASWLDEEERYEPTGTTAEVLQAAQRGGLGECSSQVAFGPESAFCGSTLSTKDGTTFVLGTGDYLRFRNMPKMATGQMKWREKMLATSGLFVLRVDPNEWGAMNSEERKVAYLRRKL